MSEAKMLVVGARGMVGRAAVEHFEAQPGWSVVGLSRRAADFDTSARFLLADLRDRQALERAAQDGALRGVTHVAYAALFEKPQLAAGWRDDEQIAINLEMLRNLIEVVERESSQLRHVSLLQGTKAYGVHLGAMRVPAKERSPRFEHPNFYFVQEDWLKERAAKHGRYAISVLRPQIIFGLAVGSPMNVVATLGAFAALQKARGEAIFHPGVAEGCTEGVDAALIAEALEWVATEPRCGGETYNLANGDALVWRELFPALAAHFGIELAKPRPMSMAQSMPEHAGLWNELVKRDGLRFGLDELIGASWQYADLLWANPLSMPVPCMVSTIKARKHGFQACRDTEDLLIEQIDRMQRERMLPR